MAVVCFRGQLDDSGLLLYLQVVVSFVLANFLSLSQLPSPHLCNSFLLLEGALSRSRSSVFFLALRVCFIYTASWNWQLSTCSVGQNTAEKGQPVPTIAQPNIKIKNSVCLVSGCNTTKRTEWHQAEFSLDIVEHFMPWRELHFTCNHSWLMSSEGVQ